MRRHDLGEATQERVFHCRLKVKEEVTERTGISTVCEKVGVGKGHRVFMALKGGWESTEQGNGACLEDGKQGETGVWPTVSMMGSILVL